MKNLSEVLDYTPKDKQYVVSGDSLDYCVRLENNRVKLSWLALSNLSDLTEYFLKQLDNKFVDDISYYLARDAVQNPVSKAEAAVCKKLLNEKLEKLHKRRLRQMARRKEKKLNTSLKKEQGKYLIDFQ